MSTELSIAQDRGMSTAELMGFSTGSSSGGTSKLLDRVKQVQNPIMGEIEVDGQKLKTEAVPIGAFEMTNGQNVVYSTSATVRIFMVRQQWKRWNSESNKMERTVLASSLSGDLQDNTGGFNLGRPSGYIEDFNALPQATKELMRDIKRVKVYMGTITLDNPTDDKGKPVNVGSNFTDLPFVMDVKNRDSLKSIDSVCAAITKGNELPMAVEIKLTGQQATLGKDKVYGTIQATKGKSVGSSESDNALLSKFLEYIDSQNGQTLDDHYANNKKSVSPEDAKVVNGIIDSNDFTEVE